MVASLSGWLVGCSNGWLNVGCSQCSTPRPALHLPLPLCHAPYPPHSHPTEKKTYWFVLLRACPVPQSRQKVSSFLLLGTSPVPQLTKTRSRFSPLANQPGTSTLQNGVPGFFDGEPARYPKKVLGFFWPGTSPEHALAGICCILSHLGTLPQACFWEAFGCLPESSVFPHRLFVCLPSASLAIPSLSNPLVQQRPIRSQALPILFQSSSTSLPNSAHNPHPTLLPDLKPSLHGTFMPLSPT